MPKRVLIVSPHFAPVNAPDGHRARMLVPWLPQFGWEPTVLTTRPDRAVAPVEPALLGTLPTDLRVVRSLALSPAIGRRLGLGNLGWRALSWLWREGSRLLWHEKFDLVYFTTTQFACVPLGRWWRDGFGVPYVIDLQDPWHNTFYAQPDAPAPPGGWKYRVAALTTAAAEAWTLRRCSHVVAVSDRYIDDLCRRRPWFPRNRASSIPMGWSERDQAEARRRPPPASSESRVILYCGRVGDDMARCLRILLGRFAQWRRTRPEAKLEWKFVGTSYAGQGMGSGVPSRIAHELGLSACVSEPVGRIGYLDALRQQQSSAANLVLGSDDAAYSPSKIWPMLATGRPWLACIDDNSTVATLLRPHASLGLLLSASALKGSPTHQEHLNQWFDALSAGRLPINRPAAALGELHADRLAQRHVAIFDQVTGL